MKKHMKLVTLFLAGAMALSLAACSGGGGGGSSASILNRRKEAGGHD